MKNTADKTKKDVCKSARISIRNTPENKADFIRRAKAQGCTQTSLFESILRENQSWERKVPPQLFIPVDNAINDISRCACDYDISYIKSRIRIISESITKIKNDYGYGGKK